MRIPRASIAVAAAWVLLLAGCASASSVDLDTAKRWADTSGSADVDDVGFAGSAALQVGREDTESSVFRIDFATPEVPNRLEAACYGSPQEHVTASISITLVTGAGEGSPLVREIPCDTEPRTLRLAGPAADGIVIEAMASTETYIRATAFTGTARGR